MKCIHIRLYRLNVGIFVHSELDDAQRRNAQGRVSEVSFFKDDTSAGAYARETCTVAFRDGRTLRLLAARLIQADEHFDFSNWRRQFS